MRFAGRDRRRPIVEILEVDAANDYPCRGDLAQRAKDLFPWAVKNYDDRIAGFEFHKFRHILAQNRRIGTSPAFPLCPELF